MPTWTQQVEDLLTSALMLARSRTGRIAALNVSVPESMPLDQVRSLLRTRLAACGYPGVEVAASAGLGALRITSAEFER